MRLRLFFAVHDAELCIRPSSGKARSPDKTAQRDQEFPQTSAAGHLDETGVPALSFDPYPGAAKSKSLKAIHPILPITILTSTYLLPGLISNDRTNHAAELLINLQSRFTNLKSVMLDDRHRIRAIADLLE